MFCRCILEQAGFVGMEKATGNFQACFSPVFNINADFLAPVFFSDKLIIETAVIHIGHKSFTLVQRAINQASGVLKCQCRTVMVGYDVATKEPVDIPLSYKKAICSFEGKTLEELSAPL